MLENCCCDVEAPVVALAEVGVCLAQILACGLVCLTRGMLFVAVAEVRL
jgi:hypothetical protein